jgi:hypothetical protein
MYPGLTNRPTNESHYWYHVVSTTVVRLRGTARLLSSRRMSISSLPNGEPISYGYYQTSDEHLKILPTSGPLSGLRS